MSSEDAATRDPDRATLALIATDASVSVSTVSKVLNGRKGVSSETRARVEGLLRSHGYNRRGTSPAAELIEVVFSELDSYWAIDIIRGVERVASEEDMGLVLTKSGDRHSPSPDWIESVIRRRPVAVVLIFSDLSPEHKQRLQTQNIPFVVVDPAGDPAPDVPSVGSANWAGGVLATQHLIDLGHRSIAMITGPTDMMCSRARVGGFRSAMESAGLPVKETSILGGNFLHEGGVARAKQLLTSADPPTAIFAGSDIQALGVYEAARLLGVNVPVDLSVVGYDDVQIARLAGPALTTVRQPLSDMAEQAARLALRLRTKRAGESLRIDLGVDLVVRESTRAPNRPISP